MVLTCQNSALKSVSWLHLRDHRLNKLEALSMIRLLSVEASDTAQLFLIFAARNIVFSRKSSLRARI